MGRITKQEECEGIEPYFENMDAILYPAAMPRHPIN